RLRRSADKATPVCESKSSWSPSRIRPASGWSRPAMARSSVVLPLPEGPSSATTSPRPSSNETPLSTSLGPRRLVTLETSSLPMQAPPQSQCHRQAGGYQNDVDHRQRCDDVDSPGRPERDDQRPDHLGTGPKQVDSGGVLPHEDHENQE